MNQKNQPKQLDIFLDYYNQKYPTQNDKIIQGICALGISLSILGLSWALPFPHLGFLGQYNSYFNWASFIIAISIYYYSNLSPLLSYVMLFLALIFTYLISTVEQNLQGHLQTAGLFGLILMLSLLLHYLHGKKKSKGNVLNTKLAFIRIGPIWIVSLLLKRFKSRF